MGAWHGHVHRQARAEQEDRVCRDAGGGGRQRSQKAEPYHAQTTMGYQGLRRHTIAQDSAEGIY